MCISLDVHKGYELTSYDQSEWDTHIQIFWFPPSHELMSPHAGPTRVYANCLDEHVRTWKALN